MSERTTTGVAEAGLEGQSVRVLCIAGSPRRRGNSEQLLDAFIRGVNNAGGLAHKVVVSEYGIEPCRSCNSCSRTRTCVVRDRMHEIYPLIDGADAIVIASPVYFATVPAVLKALYDRCQPYWARIYVRGEARPPKRPGGLLLVGGGGDPFGSGCAVTTTKSVLAVLGVQYEVEVKVEGPDAAGDISERPDVLECAEKAGSDIVTKVLEFRQRAL
jgi:multimeric flavodoxin WrbA